MSFTQLSSPRRFGWPELAALLLGAISVCGFAPYYLYPLPLLALALLFVLWQRSATPQASARLGWWWGCGFFLCGVSWVYISLHDVGGMAAPLAILATLLFCAVLALFPLLAGWLFGRWRSAAPGAASWRDALLAAALWLFSEWLRGWLFTGFPWLSLGYSQSPPSPLAGYASVVGVYGLGLIAAFIAALAAFLLRARPLPSLLLITLLLAGGALLQRMDWTQPSGAPISVTLLQGNISQSTKWDAERIPHSLRTYLRLADANPAQLVVMPETALPLFFDEIPREYLRLLTEKSAVLTGVAIALDATAEQAAGYTNAAVLLTSELRAQVYAKRHLVPFGEYVPPGFAWFLGLINMPMSDFTAGPPRQRPLLIAGQKIAPNICYEDLFGEEIIRALPEATLLINLSNTAWFGDSLAQPQHLQIAQLRALETGRSMLRATNTGMTAAINPAGQVMAVLPPFTLDALKVQVQGHTGMTPYARWGNLPALLLGALALLPAWRARRRQRQAATGTQEHTHGAA